MRNRKLAIKNKSYAQSGKLFLVRWALLMALIMLAACEQAPPEPPEEGKAVETALAEPPATPPPDAIPINSETDLKNIGKKAEFPLGGSYKLAADLALNDWTPLGSRSKPFTGAFYGMGKTITISGGTGGLFAYIKGKKAKAAVRDLVVQVTASASGGSIGGIAGSADNALIENCAATVDLALAGTGHNAAVGGIVGTMGNNSTVRGCTASGKASLSSDNSAGLMVYAGGIAGYSGTPGLAGGGSSGCLIEKSTWTGAASASGGYPYAGGIVGYNYTGAAVKRCSAAGSARAVGSVLPYAGGIAGYNSGYAESASAPSLIENCFSTASVRAESASKAALAGGIAGANAAGALIARCYAAGAVTAGVAGNGTDNLGGAIGVQAAASAGGIAGAQYVKRTVDPAITACAALNPSIIGEDSASGAAWNIFRIAGAGAEGSDTGVFTNNIARSDMAVTNHASSWDKTANGKDGADTEAKPGQAAYAALGWDFSGVWQMGGDDYPALR
jgi:hypothetical protein